MSDNIQRVVLHQKDANNNDIILRPQTETSQIVDFELVTNSMIDTKIAATSLSTSQITNFDTIVNNMIDTKIAALPLADNNDYPIVDNVNY